MNIHALRACNKSVRQPLLDMFVCSFLVRLSSMLISVCISNGSCMVFLAICFMKICYLIRLIFKTYSRLVIIICYHLFVLCYKTCPALCISFQRPSSLTRPGLEVPLNSYLEGALCKFHRSVLNAPCI